MCVISEHIKMECNVRQLYIYWQHNSTRETIGFVNTSVTNRNTAKD